MHRHVLLMIAAGLLAAMPLAAAGDDEAAAPESDEPVKLVTTFWGGSVKATAFENSAAAYMEKHPNVVIELINIPGGDYSSKLLAMIAGGTPPDVININSFLTLELDGMLVELTDKMDDLGYFDPHNGLYQGWFTMLSSDGFYDRGESLYQAPLGTGTTILAYNKRLFDEAGVAHPTADWTWDGEFLEAAKMLSEPENQWGVNGINRGRFGITGAVAGGVWRHLHRHRDHDLRRRHAGDAGRAGVHAGPDLRARRPPDAGGAGGVRRPGRHVRERLGGDVHAAHVRDAHHLRHAGSVGHPVPAAGSGRKLGAAVRRAAGGDGVEREPGARLGVRQPDQRPGGPGLLQHLERVQQPAAAARRQHRRVPHRPRWRAAQQLDPGGRPQAGGGNRADRPQHRPRQHPDRRSARADLAERGHAPRRR